MLAKKLIEGVLSIINGEDIESVEISSQIVRRQSF